jgi:DNA-binding CsgD family transcriptional regulator
MVARGLKPVPDTETESKSFELTAEESGRFLRIVAECGCIRSHYDVYRWLGGEVQYFLPHEILLSAWGDFETWDVKLDLTSGVPGVRTGQLADCRVESLVRQMYAHWTDAGRQPVLLNAGHTEALQPSCHCPIHTALRGMRSVLVHGMHDKRSGRDSLFIAWSRGSFTNGRSPVRFFAAIEPLIAQIDSAFRRIAAFPLAAARLAAPDAANVLDLSERQRAERRSTRISLEEFSNVTAAIHAAAAFPERWPEALSAVAHLVASPEVNPSLASPEVNPSRDRGWQNVLASLDQLGVTAFIVNANSTVQQQNESARNLLAGDESIRVANSRLRFSDSALNATLEAALRNATQPSRRSSVFPVRAGKNEVYEVNVSPLKPADKSGPAAALPLALVVIVRPLPDAERIARRVRRLYGLTEAEARVAAALALGETVEQIAVAHGVRVSTVRAQVRSIFEKTGVHRQTDLVRLALNGGSLFLKPDR